MKRIIRFLVTVGGVFLLATAPALNANAFFPHLTELYLKLEQTALDIIPDEIERLIALLNEKLA